MSDLPKYYFQDIPEDGMEQIVSETEAAVPEPSREQFDQLARSRSRSLDHPAVIRISRGIHLRPSLNLPVSARERVQIQLFFVLTAPNLTAQQSNDFADPVP